MNLNWLMNRRRKRCMCNIFEQNYNKNRRFSNSYSLMNSHYVRYEKKNENEEEYEDFTIICWRNEDDYFCIDKKGTNEIDNPKKEFDKMKSKYEKYISISDKIITIDSSRSASIA